MSTYWAASLSSTTTTPSGQNHVCLFIAVLNVFLTENRTSVAVRSQEIERASLHIGIPSYTYLYGLPFLSLYPLLAYAYYVKYDTWLVSEEWTFLACVTLGSGHALSFLITKWNSGARAWITTKKVCLPLPSLLVLG